MTLTIVFGISALVLLVACVLLLEQIRDERKASAALKERLDAVAVPGSAEAHRLDAAHWRMKAELNQKLADDKSRHVATLLSGRREDEATIRLLRTEVERLERRQMVAQVFPRLGLHVGRA